MIDIGCSSSSWRQAGLCGAALGIMPLDGRRGETGKKGELQGVLTVHLGKKKIGQKTYQSTQYFKVKVKIWPRIVHKPGFGALLRPLNDFNMSSNGSKTPQINERQLRGPIEVNKGVLN